MRLAKTGHIVFLMFLLILTSCQTKKAEEKQSEKYVKTQKILDNTQFENLIFNGRVKEKRIVPLSFRVAGPITHLNVQIGDFVEKGQLIASIDKRDYKLQLSAKKAQYEQLKDEYARYQQLYEDDKLPANSYEKIKSGYLMAKSAYENAVHQLEDTDLKAPFSGYIYSQSAEKFQTVGAGFPVVIMLDLSKLEIITYIPENQINLIKHSENSYVKIDNAGISKLPVNITSIGQKTEKNGLYKVRLLLENTQNKNILPGMTAEITVIYQQTQSCLRVPSSAIFNDGESNYVWLYDPNSQTVKKSKIEIGNFVSNNQVTVNSGLSSNSIIVTAGVNSLSEGEKVRTIEEPSKSNVGELL